MHCIAFPHKPCGLLTCFTKKHCLWTQEEIDQAKKDLEMPKKKPSKKDENDKTTSSSQND